VRVGLLVGKRVVTAMLVAATVAACSGGDDNGTEPTPTIDIVATPTTATVSQGGNTTVNVALTRSGGFAGDVTLAVESPTGSLITGTAAPATLGSSVTSSVITLTAGAAAPTGAVTVTIRATGTGVTAKTATVALTVNASVTPTYSLAATAATVAAGGTGTSNITITRTGGFTGNVTLAATGLPTGVTAAFNPNNTGTNASVLTFTAAANAVAGTSTVTVTGTATGQTEKTTTLQLTVTPAGGGASYSLAATGATVAAGATGTSNVTITRTGGFAGNVTLAATGLPTGVTAAFNPNNTGTNASVLTFTAAANAAAGTSTVTVTGTADGQTEKTTTLQLTVTAAAGNFTLALNPTTLSVQQGATGTTTVTITRTNGFAGAVNLTATGLPNGVTAAFNPAGPTGNTSTLTLTAAANATVGGPTTVTVRGNATGITEQTATLALTVTQAVGGSGNTTWEFCTASQTPVWVAIQDGATGTWSRVTPTGTKFQFNITQSRGAIAYVLATTSPSVAAARSFAERMSIQMQLELLMRNRATSAAAARYAANAAVDGFALTIYYGTQQELNSFGTTQCLPGAGKTLNGTVAGLGSQQTANITLGTESGSVSNPNTTYQLTNVPDGALDLIAARSTLSLNPLGFVLDKLIIRRAQNFANNATIPVLDFGAAEAFDPAQANVTLGNLGTDQGYVFTNFFTAAGNSATGATLLASPFPSAGPFKYYGVPTARQITGDMHQALGFAVPNSQTLDQFRFAGLYFKDPTDRTVTLGPTLTAPTVSVAATTPYVRMRATGPIQSQYNKFVQVQYIQATTTVARSASIFASEAFLTGSANYDFTIPDFSGVAGWDNNWGMKTGAQTQWTVTGVSFTGVGYFAANPVEGSTLQAASRAGTITP
jgi:hypothetical protein